MSVKFTKKKRGGLNCSTSTVKMKTQRGFKRILKTSRHIFNGLSINVEPKLTGEELVDRDKDLAKRRIYVCGITTTMTNDDLWDIFSELAPVRLAYIDKNWIEENFSKNYGFIVLETEEDAHRLVRLKSVPIPRTELSLEIKPFRIKSKKIMGEGEEEGKQNFDSKKQKSTGKEPEKGKEGGLNNKQDPGIQSKKEQKSFRPKARAQNKKEPNQEISNSALEFQNLALGLRMVAMQMGNFENFNSNYYGPDTFTHSNPFQNRIKGSTREPVSLEEVTSRIKKGYGNIWGFSPKMCEIISENHGMALNNIRLNYSGGVRRRIRQQTGRNLRYKKQNFMLSNYQKKKSPFLLL